MTMGCPYGAGPACPPELCDGWCWMSDEAKYGPEPQPCEGCHWVTGEMTICRGLCKGLTAENAEERRRQYGQRRPGA